MSLVSGGRREWGRHSLLVTVFRLVDTAGLTFILDKETWLLVISSRWFGIRFAFVVCFCLLLIVVYKNEKKDNSESVL